MKYGNATDYDERGFPPPLEPGEYELTVDDIHEEDKDGIALKDKSGYPYIRVIFTVKGEDNKLFSSIYPNPDANDPYFAMRAAQVKQLLMATGLPLEGGDTAALTGKKCIGFVTINEKKGKKYNNIREYRPLESGGELTHPNDDQDPMPF